MTLPLLRKLHSAVHTQHGATEAAEALNVSGLLCCSGMTRFPQRLVLGPQEEPQGIAKRDSGFAEAHRRPSRVAVTGRLACCERS